MPFLCSNLRLFLEREKEKEVCRSALLVMVIVVTNHSSKVPNNDDIPDDQREHRSGTEDQFGCTALFDARSIGLIVLIRRLHLKHTDQIDTQMKEMMPLTEEIQRTGTKALRKIEGEERCTEKKENDLRQMIDQHVTQRETRRDDSNDQRNDRIEPHQSAREKLKNTFQRGIGPMKVVLSETVRETRDNAARKKNEHEVMFDFLVVPLRRRIVDMHKS